MREVFARFVRPKKLDNPTKLR